MGTFGMGGTGCILEASGYLKAGPSASIPMPWGGQEGAQLSASASFLPGEAKKNPFWLAIGEAASSSAAPFIYRQVVRINIHLLRLPAPGGLWHSRQKETCIAKRGEKRLQSTAGRSRCLLNAGASCIRLQTPRRCSSGTPGMDGIRLKFSADVLLT